MRKIPDKTTSSHNFKTHPKVCRINRELFPQEAAGDGEKRMEQISNEFKNGFHFLQKYDLAATFFGSARCGVGDDVYQNADELAYRLAEIGFAVITGGAAGVMEAANRGAHRAGGDSVGININLPMEQTGNSYTTDSIDFHHFFVRKVMLTFASEVYIYFPGGFGTLDEFFEILTLVQTKKIEPIPMILFGKSYWGPLLEWFEQDLYGTHHTISQNDLGIYYVVDSVDEAFELITNEVCVDLIEQKR